jgi:hypothetical protein
MAELKLVTLVAPKLTASMFYPAAVSAFLVDWDKYVARVALIPGLIPAPMDLSIDRELLDSWVDMGRIPDETPASIVAFLTAQAIQDAPLVDIRTVFTLEVLGPAFNLAMEPAARVQSLFTCVMKLIRAKNLRAYLLRRSNLKEVQNLILDAVQPADAAAVIRLKIKSREIPFTMLELQDEILIIVKYEDQKRGIAISASRDQKASDRSSALPTRQVVSTGAIHAVQPAAVTAPAAPQTLPDLVAAPAHSSSTLLDRGGKPVKCYGCGGNHWVQQCPSKTPAEKATLVAEANAKKAGVWQRDSNGRLVKETTPARAVPATAAASPSAPAQYRQFQSADKGLEIADAVFGGRISSAVLLDCGANYPVISASLVQCLHVLENRVYALANVPKHLSDITLGDNQTTIKVEGLFRSSLSFKNCGEIIVDFLVVSMDLPHIVLGNNILKCYGVNVKEQFLQAVGPYSKHELAHGDSKEAPTISVFAIGSGSDPQPYRYEPNRGADTLATEMMEDVLLPSIDPNGPTIIPETSKLFPVSGDSTLSIAEQAVLDSLSERLPSLIYTGSDAYLGSEFRIDLVADAVPHRCRNRGLTPPVRKFLEHCRDDWLKKGYISPIGQDVEWCSFVFAVPKPGEEGYRAVVDYVGLNKQTRSTTYPMPFLEASLDKLAGSKYFSILDLFKGYRQCKTEEVSGNYLAIMLLDQVYRVNRLFEGAKNAVAYFQALFSHTMQLPLTEPQQASIIDRMPPDKLGGYEYLEDWESVRLWIDDSLIHGKELIPFLFLLERVLIRLRDARLRLNLSKSVFCTQTVVHVGRQYSASGIRLDPERVQALLNIPLPKTGSDLMYFLNSLNWNRNCIPHYTSEAAPLYELLQTITQEVGSRKKRSASRVLLIERWTTEHSLSFESLKSILARQVLLAFPKAGYFLFLFTDASDAHHAAVLMQSAPDEQSKPLTERSFEPLGFCCGSFRDASRNWDIQSKEGYALLHGLDKLRFLIAGKVTLVIDHNNFSYLFASAEPQVDKITQRRILRWRQTLAQWDYDVLFIPGSLIPWVDYLTRGGSQASVIQPTDDGPVLAAMHLLSSTSDDTYVWPNFQSPTVLAAYAAYTDDAKDDWFRAHNFQLVDGILQTPDGIILIPTRNLQVCVLIAAHCGAAMHRGIPIMTAALSDRFVWKTMHEDIKAFVNQCLHCLTAKTGVRVPRPWGNVLRGTRPNEVVHLDFVTLLSGNKKKEGRKSECCHMVDSMSTFHLLYSTESTTAVEAALALQHWIINFGFPTWIISDRGSAFISELFHEITTLFKVQHQMVVAHTHTGNGKVERGHRTFLAMLRALLSELRIPSEDWEELLPLIQHGINNTPSKNLAGRAPIEIFLGLPRSDPLDGILLSRAKRTVSVDTARSEDYPEIFKALVADYMAGRESDHANLIEVVNTTVNRRRQVNDTYNRKHFKPETPNFMVGSYCMVSSVGLTPKLTSDWTGPYRVVEIINSHVYRVQDLVDENRSITVHAARMLTFSNDFLLTDIGVKEQAAFFKSGFEVRSIQGCRQANGKHFELLVAWVGFDEMDNTWEVADGIWDTASESVTNFIVEMKDSKLAKKLCRYLLTDYDELIAKRKKNGEESM